jgi:hypothetical protein
MADVHVIPDILPQTNMPKYYQYNTKESSNGYQNGSFGQPTSSFGQPTSSFGQPTEAQPEAQEKSMFSNPITLPAWVIGVIVVVVLILFAMIIYNIMNSEPQQRVPIEAFARQRPQPQPQPLPQQPREEVARKQEEIRKFEQSDDFKSVVAEVSGEVYGNFSDVTTTGDEFIIDMDEDPSVGKLSSMYQQLTNE